MIVAECPSSNCENRTPSDEAMVQDPTMKLGQDMDSVEFNRGCMETSPLEIQLLADRISWGPAVAMVKFGCGLLTDGSIVTSCQYLTLWALFGYILVVAVMVLNSRVNIVSYLPYYCCLSSSVTMRCWLLFPIILSYC